MARDLLTHPTVGKRLAQERHDGPPSTREADVTLTPPLQSASKSMPCLTGRDRGNNLHPTEANLTLEYVPTLPVTDFCTGLLAAKDLFLFQGSVAVPGLDQMDEPVVLDVDTRVTAGAEWVKLCSVDLRAPCLTTTTTNDTLECCSRMTSGGEYGVNISGVAVTSHSLAEVRMVWLSPIPTIARSRFPLIYGPPSVNVSVGSTLHKIDLDGQCELSLTKSKSGITFCVGYLESPVLTLHLNERLDQVPEDRCVRGVFEVVKEVPQSLRFSYQDGCGRSKEFSCRLSYNIPCITGDCSKMPSGRYAPCHPECLKGIFYRCYRGVTYTELCPTLWVKNELGFMVKTMGIFHPSAGACVVNAPTCPRTALACIRANCTGLSDGTYASCPPNCAMGWFYTCHLGNLSTKQCEYGWYSDRDGRAYEARMIYDPAKGHCRRYVTYCSEYVPNSFEMSVGSTLNGVLMPVLLMSMLTFGML